MLRAEWPQMCGLPPASRMQPIVDTLLWTERVREAADDLAVTQHMLVVGLANLHPSEQRYLHGRLDRREEVA